MTTFDLRTVKLRPGLEYRGEVEVELAPLALGGQRYLPVPEKPNAGLSYTKATTGSVFRLRFETTLHGPCFRCLEDATLALAIDATEYQATNPGDEDELRTEYLADDRLDLSAWAHDAVALALPDKILCRPECAGLCPVCGKNLNDEPHAHDEEHVDSRWSALEELRERL